MKVAALDLGSNTFLCLIVEGQDGRMTKILQDDVETVRLGQDVGKTGRFHEEALVRAEACLKRFREKVDSVGVDRIDICATAAARSVSNGDELLNIGRRYGFSIRIIPGEDEARLSYNGAWSSFQDEKTRLVVDIGGGSTELIVGQGRQLLKAVSLPLGGVRQTEAFISAQPIAQSEAAALRKNIRETLQKTVDDFSTVEIDELVAVAGTPTAIAAAELGGFDAAKVDGFDVSHARLQQWCEIFRETSVEEKKQKFGLEGRADIIFAGATILESVVSSFGFSGLKVSTRGLRYGLALDLLSSR